MQKSENREKKMKQIIINESDAGQRLDKYLNKLLKDAGKSFIYKMLRKKNITLNEKKADGSEHLKAGDEIRIFFSDETSDLSRAYIWMKARSHRLSERRERYGVKSE